MSYKNAPQYRDDALVDPSDARSVNDIRTWIDEQITQIERGDITEARAALKREGWRADAEFTDLPDDTVDLIKTRTLAAWDALRDPIISTDAALNSLISLRDSVDRENDG